MTKNSPTKIQFAKDIFSKARAAILDFDGTIIDSEEIGVDVATKLMKENFGVALSASQKNKKYGAYDPDYYASLFKELGINYPLKDIMREHNSIYDKLILQIKRPLPGVKEVLDSLRMKNFRIAICSSAFRHQIESVLKNLELEKYFDEIVSAQDCEKHKPNPDPYLLTAQKIGANPPECVVFEDSIFGVRAAKSAGMYCIGVKIGNHGANALIEADRAIHSFEELKI